ncbi:MAG: DUF4091 domain-containing protein [Candidatus Sumerlaeota bacterium]|nr:DUF4091 domain-containing protein [Candidatus Sumerlaeota bacterium]
MRASRNPLRALLYSAAALCGLFHFHAGAQTVPVPNPSFEEGHAAPNGWTLSGGQGEWIREGAEGNRAIAVRGDGKGANAWESEPLALDPAAVYQLTFAARTMKGSKGTAVAGPRFCNMDMAAPPTEWKRYSMVFVAPDSPDRRNAFLRFGQWQLNGEIQFDDVRLVRAQPINANAGDLSLGEGESARGNEYRFQFPLPPSCGNWSRPLVGASANYNSNRWWFTGSDEAVYRHEIGRRQQTKATVEAAVTYYRGGELVVDASADGQTWTEIGRIGGLESKEFPLPGSLLPAKAVWVRFRTQSAKAEGAALAKDDFQVGRYSYTATFDGEPAELLGSTRYLAVGETDPRVAVAVDSLGEGLPGENVARLRLAAPPATGPAGSATLPPLRPTIEVTQNGKSVRSSAEVKNGSGEQTVNLPFQIPDAGEVNVRLSVGAGVKYLADTAWRIASYYSTSYGERLPGSSGELALWWASSGWKVPPSRRPPDARGEAIRICAARNEAEAAQLVLCSASDVNLQVGATDLTLDSKGATIPSRGIELLREQYLDVEQPTDWFGVAAPWPDPLQPIGGALELKAGVNQPLWVRVKVPRGAPAGVYSGSIALKGVNTDLSVPLRVEVFDFDLPDRMTCETAFGFYPSLVWDYQDLKTDEEKRAVLDKYWADFSAHHISPYDPAPLDPFKASWPGAKKGDFTPVFDWAAWDREARRVMDEYHFNTLRLPMSFLKAPGRKPPSMAGYAEGTPEYQEALNNYLHALQEHLREQGLLDEAYVYWFDEPTTEEYPYVMNGMRKLKEGAPDLRRMLTEQVEPALVGGPNLWCPISNRYNHERAEERRKAGEHFWWYICTGPKAPYCTEFIDHPATELRVWLWQTWQRGIDGILIWQTNFWTSPKAYADPDHPQNPYDDPMSWQSSSNAKPGARMPWGNGDGRFIYPPLAAADAHPAAPVLDGPVDSIRWEMLRDGIEDYEYLAILKRLIEEKRAKLSDAERQRFEALLEVPESITKDITTFTADPAPIEKRREEVARAVESLE